MFAEIACDVESTAKSPRSGRVIDSIQQGPHSKPRSDPVWANDAKSVRFLSWRGCDYGADLAQTPTSGIRVQACGDCHLMNFGGSATPERRIIFDINDFDETLPAPWEWDLKRLAASFVLAGRNNRFQGSGIA